MVQGNVGRSNFLVPWPSRWWGSTLHGKVAVTSELLSDLPKQVTPYTSAASARSRWRHRSVPRFPLLPTTAFCGLLHPATAARYCTRPCSLLACSTPTPPVDEVQKQPPPTPCPTACQLSNRRRDPARCVVSGSELQCESGAVLGDAHMLPPPGGCHHPLHSQHRIFTCLLNGTVQAKCRPSVAVYPVQVPAIDIAQAFEMEVDGSAPWKLLWAASSSESEAATCTPGPGAAP
jgi:hypothetical protein